MYIVYKILTFIIKNISKKNSPTLGYFTPNKII